MIKLIPMAAEQVVGVQIDGQIQKADIEAVKSAFAAKFAQFNRVSIYVEVVHLGGITLDALLEDLKFALSKFSRFQKKAVVSEHKWLDKWVKVGDKLFPSIQVKHFGVEAKTDAVVWVSAPEET